MYKTYRLHGNSSYYHTVLFVLALLLLTTIANTAYASAQATIISDGNQYDPRKIVKITLSEEYANKEGFHLKQETEILHLFPSPQAVLPYFYLTFETAQFPATVALYDKNNTNLETIHIGSFTSKEYAKAMAMLKPNWLLEMEWDIASWQMTLSGDLQFKINLIIQVKGERHVIKPEDDLGFLYDYIYFLYQRADTAAFLVRNLYKDDYKASGGIWRIPNTNNFVGKLDGNEQIFSITALLDNNQRDIVKNISAPITFKKNHLKHKNLSYPIYLKFEQSCADHHALLNQEITIESLNSPTSNSEITFNAKALSDYAKLETHKTTLFSSGVPMGKRLLLGDWKTDSNENNLALLLTFRKGNAAEEYPLRFQLSGNDLLISEGYTKHKIDLAKTQCKVKVADAQDGLESPESIEIDCQCIH